MVAITWFTLRLQISGRFKLLTPTSDLTSQAPINCSINDLRAQTWCEITGKLNSAFYFFLIFVGTPAGLRTLGLLVTDEWDWRGGGLWGVVGGRVEEKGSKNNPLLPALSSRPVAVIGPHCKNVWTNQRGERTSHPVRAVTVRAEHRQPGSESSAAAAMVRGLSRR